MPCYFINRDEPDGLVDAEPEVLLALATPGEDRYAGLSQGGRHLVLRAVDVAGGPAHLHTGHINMYRITANDKVCYCWLLPGPPVPPESPPAQLSGR